MLMSNLQGIFNKFFEKFLSSCQFLLTYNDISGIIYQLENGLPLSINQKRNRQYYELVYKSILYCFFRGRNTVFAVDFMVGD